MISFNSSKLFPTSLPFPDMVSRRTVVVWSGFKILLTYLQYKRFPHQYLALHGFQDENYRDFREWIPISQGHLPWSVSQNHEESDQQSSHLRYREHVPGMDGFISFCLKEKAGDIILIQSFGIAASRVAGKILESVCVDLQGIFCHGTVAFRRW